VQISELSIRNFKCFSEQKYLFSPNFNLLVGENGSGKSSLLDAIAVAAGSWFLGISGCDTRHILSREVRLEQLGQGRGVTFEKQFPSEIFAKGFIEGNGIAWSRSLNGEGGRTTSINASKIKSAGVSAEERVRSGGDVVLPLLSYYGTGRLWQEPRKTKEKKSERRSRLIGYKGGMDARVSSRELISWLKKEDWIAFQDKSEGTPISQVVKASIISCIEGGKDVFYDAGRDEVVVEIDGQGSQSFENLSDGQRNIIAMVGDIAIKAATLNPQLGERVLQDTPGIILIDELDLHLHPIWQRKVIEDLRKNFPKVQFFATTHSPFLIQTLRQGELLYLGEESNSTYVGRGVEDVARHIMGVDMPEVSPRYQEMIDAARRYFRLLESARDSEDQTLLEAKNQLDELTILYSDNPAYVALLDLKGAEAGIER